MIGGKLLGDTAAVTALLDRCSTTPTCSNGRRQQADESADRIRLRTEEANEVELTGLGRPEIAGLDLSTNCGI